MAVIDNIFFFLRIQQTAFSAHIGWIFSKIIGMIR